MPSIEAAQVSLYLKMIYFKYVPYSQIPFNATLFVLCTYYTYIRWQYFILSCQVYTLAKHFYLFTDAFSFKPHFILSKLSSTQMEKCF